MSGITIQINDREVLESLGRLAGRVNDMQPVMEEIGAALKTSVQMRFERETGPDGQPWKPSLRAQAEGGQTLRDTGRLLQSITYRASAGEAEVGTNVIYAAVQQFGARITAKNAPALRFQVGGRWARKQSVDIPPRPFLGIDDADRREIGAIVADYLSGALS